MTECADTPYQAPNVLDYWKSELIKQLQTPQPTGWYATEPMDPLEAYEILFARAPDPYVVSLVQKTISRRRASLKYWKHHGRDFFVAQEPRREYRAGFVYVFWDSRDASDVLKIGATTLRTPEKRVAQWRRELGNDEITLLFAFRSRAPMLAEQLVHECLSCYNIPLRINRLTNRRLVEYYKIADFQALQYFVHAVTRYATYLHSIDRGAAPPLNPPPSE